MSELISSLTESSSEASATISVGSALLYAVIAGVLGVVIALTYMKTGKVSKNFARTLIILPILVCVVMLAVNGNLGASVAVLGAFSLVRFRSLQGTSREIMFIFFAMTVGIACSIGYPHYAAAITVLVCVIQLGLEAMHFGETKVDEKELRVTIPENLDYNTIFDDIFEQVTTSCKLVKVKTTNMGSMYELTYHIRLVEDAAEKSMIDAIRCRNGNLTVICGRRDCNPLEEL